MGKKKATPNFKIGSEYPKRIRILDIVTTEYLSNIIGEPFEVFVFSSKEEQRWLNAACFARGKDAVNYEIVPVIQKTN